MTTKPRKPIRRKPRVFPPLPFGSRLTDAELQAIVRGSNPKPRKGAATAMRRARARLAKTRERAAKDAAKLRDGYRCRRCQIAEGTYLWDSATYVVDVRMEAAHIRSAGMGGDPTGLRSWKASDYVTLCHACHQGPRSVHSGHVRIVCGDRGGDGEVWFVEGQPGPSSFEAKTHTNLRQK